MKYVFCAIGVILVISFIALATQKLWDKIDDAEDQIMKICRVVYVTDE